MIELVMKGGDPAKVVAVACSQCRFVKASQQLAIACCKPRQCTVCEAEFDSPVWTICDSCRDKRDREKESARFGQARQVPAAEYDGPVYSPNRERWFTGVEDYLDHIECHEVDPDIESYLWGSVPCPLKIDAERILESELEDHHEDAWDELGDIGMLQKAIDAWIAVHGQVTSYDVDYSTAVVLGRATDE